MDADRGGSIGTDELEDPLIGLGLVQSREEVLDLIKDVDEDGSGNIEFPEFLQIMSNIKNKSEDEQSVLYSFFTGKSIVGSLSLGMINGKLMSSMDPSLPFLLNVSMFRRRKILGRIYWLFYE